MELAEKNWYSSWFDTPYYHILYKDRNYEEAQEFMQHLTSFLEIPQGASILDLACGKGRHSIYLNELGYQVTGVDLSENSIAHAKQYENDQLSFHTHCMCEPLEETFDAVFNLFTSFGYFENEEENYKSIAAIKEELKPGGYGVIDFMNVRKVEKNLVHEEEKVVEGIRFKISRRITEGFVMKDIAFEDQGRNHHYTEKVRAICLPDFQRYFDKAGLRIRYVFGDYHLNGFDPQRSDRLILVFSE